MLAKPDPSTFQILPWRGEGPSTARMFCDIVMPDGSPSYADPRLRAQAHPVARPPRTASRSTRTPRSSSTCSRTPRRPAASRCRWTAAATSTTPRRAWARTSAARRSRCSRRWASRWSSATTRAAPASRRSTCATPTRSRTADNIMTFRTVVREVALSQGIWATFMPKPFTTHPGSGMHTHVSLFEGDRNAFFEAGAEYQLSKTGRQFIAGHPARTPREIAVVTNQWVNSYKRLMCGGEAPSYICWGHNNRSAMIRVPMYKPNKGQSTRMELRTVDSACNPYLAFAVILAAGMKGIEEGYELPREAEDDVWSLTERERKSLGIDPLPEEPVRGDRGRRELRAARRDPRRARLRLLPAQQAGRVGGVPRPGLRLRARPDAAAALTVRVAPCRPHRSRPARIGSRRVRHPDARTCWCERSTRTAQCPTRQVDRVELRSWSSSTRPVPAGVAGGVARRGRRVDVPGPTPGTRCPRDLSGHSGMLVLGGEMGAYDDADFAWLTRREAAGPLGGRPTAPRCSASAWATSSWRSRSAARSDRTRGPADRRARRRLDRRRRTTTGCSADARGARARRARRAVEQRRRDPAARRRRRPRRTPARRAAGRPVRARGVGRAVAPRGRRGDHPALGRPRPGRRGGARRRRRRLRRRRGRRPRPAPRDLAGARRPVRRGVPPSRRRRDGRAGDGRTGRHRGGAAGPARVRGRRAVGGAALDRLGDGADELVHLLGSHRRPGPGRWPTSPTSPTGSRTAPPCSTTLVDDEGTAMRLLAVLGASSALGDHLLRHPEHWHDLTDPALGSTRPAAFAVRARACCAAVGADPLAAVAGRARRRRRLRRRAAGRPTAGCCCGSPPATSRTASASTTSPPSCPTWPPAPWTPRSPSRGPGSASAADGAPARA